MVRYSWLVIVVTAALALVAACSGGGGETVDQATPDLAASVAPASTPEPSSTETALPTEVPDDEGHPTDLDTLVIPVCRTDPFAGTSVGFGTVPRDPGTIDAVSSAPVDSQTNVIVALAPVLRWVDHFISRADSAWEAAETEQDFLVAISDESRRLWLACSAFAIAAPALNTTDPFLISVTSPLGERQAWLTDQLEALRSTPGSIRDDDSQRVATSDELKSLTGSLEELAIEAGIEDWLAPVPFTVPNPLLEVGLDVPAGWLLIRNRIDIVLAAPTDLQKEGVMGLGVPGWNFGTALRVRRLRHEAPWTLADTTTLMDSLLSRFGERTTEERRQIGESDAVVRVFESRDDEWTTIATATVRNLHTYLFELGCPDEYRSQCEDLLTELLDGVRFEGT